ncbi:MAG: serine hydrolase domain-containing protein [Ilumatobacteraceae bacterium]
MPESALITLLQAVDHWPVDHVAVAVVRPDGIVASRGDIHRTFKLASVSKMLSAWAVLVAVEEGTVSLDDEVGPPGATLRHVLAHAAGYGFDTPGAITRPARNRIYSNTGIEVAAQHVAERSGIAFPTYLREAVFVPLDMTQSELHGSAAYATTSTVTDLSKFARELLRPRLVSAAMAADATSIQFGDLNGVTPGFGSFRPNPWGLGLEIRGQKNPHWTGSLNSPRTFGHFGGSGTMMWVDPDIDTSLVALTNRRFETWADVARVEWPALSDAVVGWATD